MEGNRFRVLRNRADLTQLEVANRLGINFTAVAHWERGRSMPKADNLAGLARMYHCTIDQLLGLEPLSQPSAVCKHPPNLA